MNTCIKIFLIATLLLSNSLSFSQPAEPKEPAVISPSEPISPSIGSENENTSKDNEDQFEKYRKSNRSLNTELENISKKNPELAGTLWNDETGLKYILDNAYTYPYASGLIIYYAWKNYKLPEWKWAQPYVARLQIEWIGINPRIKFPPKKIAKTKKTSKIKKEVKNKTLKQKSTGKKPKE